MREIVLKMGPRTAEQVMRVLVKELRVARLRGDPDYSNDLEALARVATDLDQQLNVRYVQVQVLSIEDNGVNHEG